MAVGAVIVAELPAPLDEPELARLRQQLMNDLRFQREDFYIDGPLRPIPSRVEGPIPLTGGERSFWINVNLWRDFYCEEYPRGDIDMLVRCAQWVEQHLPGARVWYGPDCADDDISPFPAERRAELLAHEKTLRAARSRQ
jgi:hypothetical protein